MALLAFAGAEDGLLEVLISGDVTQNSGQARTGTYCFRVKGMSPTESILSNSFTLNFPERSEFFWQAATRVSSTATYGGYNPYHIGWCKGNTFLGCLITAGTLASMFVCRGDNSGTLLGSINVGMPTNSWLLLEGHVVIHNTTGLVKVWANGILVFNYSGDTQPGSDTGVDNLLFSGTPTTSGWQYWDDMIVGDVQGSYFNSQLGGLKIHRLAPTGIGNYSQWTPAGSTLNWACVDETPVSSDDYVKGAASGNKDSYAMADCPSNVYDVQAVVARYWAQGGGGIKRLLRIGSTDYLGTTINVSTSLTYNDDIMYVSPATSNPFTVSEINSLESGMERQ